MKAFVVKVAELFKMDSRKNEDSNFNAAKRSLLIPLYQREYTWSNERISSLINDIKKLDKFIGNIILDECDEWYEIVDGQQRLTTCILTLLALYNHYDGQPMEQEIYNELIRPYGSVILKNDSVKDYIVEINGKLQLNICDNHDVYKQSKDFLRAYDEVKRIIDSFDTNDEVSVFAQKLLNSKLLVLINNEHDYTRPVEQLFLDINEKAQLLKVEDIFKGHCFEKYHSQRHELLKEKWVELKKRATEFKDFSFIDTSQYIYLYLSEIEDFAIPENLAINGRHYLENKTTDQINAILDGMISFGESVYSFYLNCKKADYRFVDLCLDSIRCQETDDHIVLKQMSLSMLLNTGAIYQKLPFMYLLYALKNHNEISSVLTHKELRRIITDLYVYMNLFLLSGIRKSKKVIDKSVRKATEQTTPVDSIISAVEQLRNDKVDNFVLPNSYSYDKLAFIYSIIDNYIPDENWMKEIYSRENHYDLACFIIPDNRTHKIKWLKNDMSFYNLTVPSEMVKTWKNCLINQLVIDEDLKGQLENYDIVYKIDRIIEWYQGREQEIPKHISILMDFIRDMPEYTTLKNLKDIAGTEDEVYSAYILFLRVLFDDNNIELHERMKNAFVESFQNTGD